MIGSHDGLVLGLLVAVLIGLAVQHYAGSASYPLCISDHPARLGGSDEPGNVWLQPAEEARRKDQAEWQAIEAYCREEITLEQARSRFVGRCHPGDW